MKKVLKFVHNQTVTGAVAEIGLLCTAVVYASPQRGVSDLMVPIMCSVLSSLEECPPTGFSGVPNPNARFDTKVRRSSFYLTFCFTRACDNIFILIFPAGIVSCIGIINHLPDEPCITRPYVCR